MKLDVILEIIKYCPERSYLNLLLLSKSHYSFIKRIMFKVLVKFSYKYNDFLDAFQFKLLTRRQYEKYSSFELYHQHTRGYRCTDTFKVVMTQIDDPQIIDFMSTQNLDFFNSSNIFENLILENVVKTDNPSYEVCFTIMKRYLRDSIGDLKVLRNLPKDILEHLTFECPYVLHFIFCDYDKLITLTQKAIKVAQKNKLYKNIEVYHEYFPHLIE